MNSTLKPGRVSDAIRKLRDSAIQEMDAPDKNSHAAGEISFDRAISFNEKHVNLDRPLDVPQYPGPHSPHIGNGSGAPL